MDSKVRPKKFLGQHFLTDKNIAAKIVSALVDDVKIEDVLEVGPGMGILTDILLHNASIKTYAIDIDAESVEWLKNHYPTLQERLFLGDFLQLNLPQMFPHGVCVIGNFPYHISSQIVFKILDNHASVPIMVGMFQREVAMRLAGKEGNKDYGVLSVLTQAMYEVQYLFTVDEHLFHPPPKVKSGVIRMKRKVEDLPVDKTLFYKVVKTAFNQRRKKLRNALHVFGVNDSILQEAKFADKRAEELSVENFYELTRIIAQHGKHNH
jgi:16S rRNA (adenine1518-N6/adenine1519-N6)-dimethyltransferase